MWGDKYLLLLSSLFLLTIVANLNMFGNYIWNCYSSSSSHLSQNTFGSCWFYSKCCKAWLGQNAYVKLCQTTPTPMVPQETPSQQDWVTFSASPGEVGALEIYSPGSLLSEWIFGEHLRCVLQKVPRVQPISARPGCSGVEEARVTHPIL